MSLSSAMYSGVSGLLSFGNAMNVTGDNIANVNTVGFKGNRTIFADILANSVANGSTTMQFGRGAAIKGVQASFAQGAFETTGNATDMAIQGAGFFVVRDATNGGNYYTRAGQFIISDKGKLVNPSGFIVQGYALSTDSAGNTTKSGAASDIDITGVQSVPKATTTFRLGINLNSAASAATTFSSSFNAYNALGETVTVTYTFTKNLAPAQSWHYVASGPAGTTLSGAGLSGTMTFSSTGVMTLPAADQPLTISGFPSGSAPLTINWELYNPVTGVSHGDITGYAAGSVTNTMVQDGYTTGVLRGLSVDDTGIISGLFSNGQTQKLRQVELADFLSPWGLSRQGNSMFAETSQSGQPIMGTAKAGGFGTIYGSSLELSSVDLSQQFVNMIQDQRAYQANSKIITTVDTMLQEVVSLVR
ncbi:MAG: flagellar hook protein FlgE [Nitrospinae bacterium]|nr:flagellar hook protein FlgE [Nitrospinota bacterium]MBF0634426.1 flagellar hook protein FlgE [Nitrospinota bacterium]